MNETGIFFFGLAGTALSVISLLPQVIRTCRTRQARDISLAWLILALVSMVVWIVYGSATGAPAIVWANVLTMIQAVIILLVKLRTGADDTAADRR